MVTQFDKGLRWNTLSGLVSLPMVAACNLATVPIAIANLSLAEYGVWLVLVNAVSSIYLADFGFTTALSRLIPKYKVTEDLQVNNLIMTSWVIIGGSALALTVLGFFLSDDIFQFLEIKDVDRGQFEAVLTILLVEVFFQFHLRFGFASLKAQHLSYLSYQSEILVAGARLLGCLALVFFDIFTLLNFALMYSGVKIIIDLLVVIKSKTLEAASGGRFTSAVIVDLVDVGGAAFLSTLLQFAYLVMPLVVFSRLFGEVNVVILSIPFAIYMLGLRLLNVLNVPYAPRAAELVAAGCTESLYKHSQTFSGATIFVGGLLCFALLGFGDFLIRLWLYFAALDSNILVKISEMLRLFSIVLFVDAISKNAVFTARATGHHWMATVESLMSICVFYFCVLFSHEAIDYLAFGCAYLVSGFFRVAYYFVVSNTESQFTFDPSPNYALLIGLATGLLFIEPENIALKMVLAALGVVFLSWQVRETEPQSLMLLKNLYSGERV